MIKTALVNFGATFGNIRPPFIYLHIFIYLPKQGLIMVKIDFRMFFNDNCFKIILLFEKTKKRLGMAIDI